jgi:ABC-type antimicrobial peptide transport system permease subunit
MVAKALVAASTKPLVLSILKNGENYGYQIIQSVRRLSVGRLEWSEPLLNPLLKRMEPDANSDIKTVRFLEIIGFVILLIAQVKAVNLATARSLRRWREICILKTLGAERRQLARQFLFESIFHNVPAFLLALGAALLTLVVALATVSFKAIRSAAANPVESIRCE